MFCSLYAVYPIISEGVPNCAGRQLKGVLQDVYHVIVINIDFEADKK